MSTATIESARSMTKTKPVSSDLMKYRAPLIFISQACLVIVTYYASFLLRLDANLDPAMRVVFWQTLPLVLLVKLVLSYRFGLLHGWWRYVGMSDLLDISKASFVSSCILFCVILGILRPAGYPRSVIPIDLVLTIMVVGGARFAVRAYTERARSYGSQRDTLIIGAGMAGSAIMRELKQNPNSNYNAVGFVDDDPSKKGMKIHGTKVLGNTDQLNELIARHGIECVLIAIPSAGGPEIARIVHKVRECRVEFKILPTISDLIDKPTSPVNQVRKLRLEDLLNRRPVQLDFAHITAKLTGKTVMVTGAGGSIGSELVRQLSRVNPRQLVLFERSENDLFKLCTELSNVFPDLNYVPIVGDILDVALLREVFSTYRPHSVFHAAAYKHVPMMERNCFQAVTNNVFGTYNVAMMARQHQAEDFVLISSDKAVNPTNIMGVTKRIAELTILGLRHSNTHFLAVRFGNVLGSNGSVVPIFEQQIAKGGPVTVTDPDARRYFMTIPEAVQLVLQASTMGRGGEIFVLDMGEPVKILDLVDNLIRLSGLEPERDIKIEFIGLRPGEKLFEELQLEGEGIKPTSHEKIRILEGASITFEQVSNFLEELTLLVESKNVHGLVSKLVQIVPEYMPSEEINALCNVDRHDKALTYRRARTGLLAVAQSQSGAANLDLAG
jgi:FlaA1/EpsC-like NDP-sugar epimerase